jgi:hypothetical protein
MNVLMVCCPVLHYLDIVSRNAELPKPWCRRCLVRTSWNWSLDCVRANRLLIDQNPLLRLTVNSHTFCRDVLSGVDYLVSKGWIDETRMGCMGWSQGGYISAFLTTSTRRFAAICVGGAHQTVALLALFFDPSTVFKAYTSAQTTRFHSCSRVPMNSDCSRNFQLGNLLLQHRHHAILSKLPRLHACGR